MRYEKMKVDLLEKVRHSVKKKSQSGKKANKRSQKPLREVLHPYLGFVYDNNRKDVSTHGFFDRRVIKNPNAPVTPKTDDNYIIGILGGSFAYGLSVSSSDGYIEQKLKEIPELYDKKIIIHTIAFGGWKQPQQLLALNYFITLGAHFDVIVNIDGFNEIVLPPAENVPKGVYPFYPRLHWFRTGKLKDETMLALMGTIALNKKKQMEYARIFSKKPLCFSVLANLVWRYCDIYFAKKKYLAEKRLADYKIKKNAQLGYESTGPSFHYDTNQDLYKDLARVWSTASLQMAQLCKENNIDYFHFLQPNQYVIGSKPMMPEEIKIAWIDGHAYKTGVEQGYPELVERGEWLLNKKVDFHDLTMIFSNNTEVLYYDMCCHLNEKGYNLIIDKIMNVIQSKYDKNELKSLKH
ncbi:hypothetical protein QUF90_08215 [Desulfococcaceae bacterium HSG9]|nr:hypothetical protein [Desulfococcaceae bacterium HSG9]